MAQFYDIIGDVHGYANVLEKLLKKLGYKKKGGTYHHRSRQAIFVGDIIDRGPQIREALHIVRRMVLEGSALMVLGNHEFNAIGWHSRWINPGEYLRPHTSKNRKQHAHTLRAFFGRKKEWKEFFDWFQTLPLSLDLGGIRVAHAAWNDIAHKYAGAVPLVNYKVPAAFFLTSRLDGDPNTSTGWYYELLCKGYETELPDGLYYLDHEGNRRTEVRTRWWLSSKGRTFSDLAFYTSLKVPNERVQDPDLPKKDYKSGPPVLFGHYAADPRQLIITPKIACLDYGIYKGHPLHAYRWDGEKELSADKIVKMTHK